jgi:serine/threonine protein kinase
MTEPPKPDPGSTPPQGAQERLKHQETILLTDVPDASSMVAESPAPSVPALEVGSVSLAALSERYDLLGEAGHGSMGNVYKARDRETGEIIALKILKPEIASDQAMMERFKNELLFARKITHKNVCRVHDFNRIGGIACISMEFVEGDSLRSVLNRFGGLPPRKGIDVALQICSGLKEAHAQGIVHRDLKPENVMIDAQGNVKIMDFGIARSMEAATRLTGSMVGTPAYMAPEQVAGKPVDFRTDVYSLGLMLYEMFTGSQVFQADTPVAVALKQMREAPPPPHEIEPTIPVGIERAILKCLEKDPLKRFQSLDELETVLRTPRASRVAGALSSLEGPRPALVPAAAPPISLPAQRPSRRGSLAFWVLLLAFAALAAVGGLHWEELLDTASRIPPPMKLLDPASRIPPPTELPPPKPPDFALEPVAAESADTSPAEPETSHSTPATSPTPAEPKPTIGEKRSAPQEAKPSEAEVPPHRETAPEKQPPEPTALDTPPPDVQERADKAFREPGKPNSAKGGGELTYLFVGRYGREQTAQDAAKKIEALGLAVTVVPRHGPAGEFYIVYTGPFGAKRVPDITQWLEAQGFMNVRPAKRPNGNASPRE